MYIVHLIMTVFLGDDLLSFYTEAKMTAINLVH
jgi:hypothetical protein